MTEAIPVRILLTQRQVRKLLPYLDRVHATAVMGNPGMLVGQFGWTRDREYYVTIAFLDHDKAKLITEAGRSQIPGTTHTHTNNIPDRT